MQFIAWQYGYVFGIYCMTNREEEEEGWGLGIGKGTLGDTQLIKNKIRGKKEADNYVHSGEWEQRRGLR